MFKKTFTLKGVIVFLRVCGEYVPGGACYTLRTICPGRQYALVDNMPRGPGGHYFRLGSPNGIHFIWSHTPHMNILICVQSGLVYIQSVPFGTLWKLCETNLKWAPTCGRRHCHILSYNLARPVQNVEWDSCHCYKRDPFRETLSLYTVRCIEK